VTSALEVIFNEMRYINLRFTYLLTYENTWKRDLGKDVWIAAFKCNWRKMETAGL